MFGARFLGKGDIGNPVGITLESMHIFKKLERCVAQTYLESWVLVFLYRGISSGGN